MTLEFEPIQTVLSIKDFKKQIGGDDGEIVFGYKYMLIGHIDSDRACVVEIIEKDSNNVLAHTKCANPIETFQKLSGNLLCPNRNNEENFKLPSSKHYSHNCDLDTCSLEEWTLRGFGFTSYRYDETTMIFRAETGERFGSAFFVSGKSLREIRREGKGETFEKALTIAFPKGL